MRFLFIRNLINFLIVVCAISIPFFANAADEFPSRHIKLIVPLAPGGGGDAVARIIASKMTEFLGQPVVVENLPGASTIIGSNYVAKAKPDGYTLLLATSSNTINGSLYKLPFDPISSFDGVSVIGTTPGIIVVHPSVPARNMSELIALARAKPGALNFASSGNASLPHLAGEMINRMADVKMVHIPYKGGGAAELDLLGGQVQIYLASPIQAISLVNAGKVRAIAVGSTQRSAIFPTIPTVSESLPGFEAITFYVLLAPAGTPIPILEKLSISVSTVLKKPTLAKQLAEQGIDIVASDSNGAIEFMKNQIERMSKIVKEANIKVD